MSASKDNTTSNAETFPPLGACRLIKDFAPAFDKHVAYAEQVLSNLDPEFKYLQALTVVIARAKDPCIIDEAVVRYYADNWFASVTTDQ